MRYNQVSNRYYRPLLRIAILVCAGSIALNVSLLNNRFELEKRNLDLKNKISQLEDKMAYNRLIQQMECRQLYLDELIERLHLDTPEKE